MNGPWVSYLEVENYRDKKKKGRRMTTKDKTYANLRISTKIEHKYWLKFLFLERKKKRPN